MTKRTQIGVGLVIILILGAVLSRSLRDSDPIYQGKPVGFWYESLCTGVFGGTPRAANFQTAYDAFPHMGPEMLPYLTGKLRYDRSGHREKVILVCRKIPFLNRMAKRIILPTERRCYAAVALRQMGPSARTAIPDLMEACVKDSVRVKLNAVGALAAILNDKVPDGLNPAQFTVVEKQVLSQAAELFPKVATELSITPSSSK